MNPRELKFEALAGVAAVGPRTHTKRWKLLEFLRLLFCPELAIFDKPENMRGVFGRIGIYVLEISAVPTN